VRRWWKEERQGVFLDYNQNARDRTTASAYSVRPVPDARVSMPLSWDALRACDPADFTLRTVPALLRAHGDAHAGIDASSYRLDSLLELAERLEREHGTGDAPWPPHHPKRAAEPRRTPPSRKASRRKTASTDADPPRGSGKRAPSAPLLVIAKAERKQDALDGLERWKARHPVVAARLAPEDILIDAMRGRSSTWTRIRINLRNVPEPEHPPEEPPDPDQAPRWR
jgi:hypothetical protein